MFQSLRNSYKSIFVKFTLMFILIGLIPITGMSYLIFEELPKEVESYMVASYGESLFYASKSIELKVRSYDSLTQNIYQYYNAENVRLIDVLRGQDYNNLPTKTTEFLENYLFNLLYADRHIVSVFLLGDEQEVFKYSSKSTQYYYDHLNLDNLPEFQSIYDANRDLTILPKHQENYFQKYDKEVITFVRDCLDINYLPESEITLATLLLEVNVSFIDEIIGRINLNEEGEFYIVDALGYSVYASDGDDTAGIDIFNTMKNSMSNNEAGHEINEGRFTCYEKIEGTDWLIFFTADKNSLLQMMGDFRTATYVILGGILIAIIFFAITFSNSLSRPIRSIIEQMKEVSAGNLDTKVSVQASYEVNQLASAFNHMTDQLRQYINEAYGAQIKQHQAELNSLKTQIRPHYLYNTLEIIRMSALEESAENTKEMIVSLSEQLKYVIGQYGDKVTLGNEIEMLENYFKIITPRYEGRIALEVDVSKEYYSCSMLKLVLQPLVENAVVHGLKVKKGKGRVRVSGKIDDDILSIDVMDNGVGMSENTVLEIQQLLESHQIGKELNGNWENIGLKNVHDRIQMNYGLEYGLTISSKENLGTKMNIRFPIN